LVYLYTSYDGEIITDTDNNGVKVSYEDLAWSNIKSPEKVVEFVKPRKLPKK
jgi:hypothetical protein